MRFRVGAFGCNLCGALMPLGEVPLHQRTVHAEALAIEEKAILALTKPLVLVFSISSVAMFVALFAPQNIFRIRVPDFYVPAVMASWIGSIVVVGLYAWIKTRPLFEPLRDILCECHVCDSRLPRRHMKDHLRERHPAEFRYLRASLFVVIGSLFVLVGGFFVLLLLTVSDVLPMVDPNLFEIILYLGIFAWLGGVILYGLFGYPRHLGRVKLSWR